MGDIVLIHGSTQSPAGWARLVCQLAARGHRGITVDLAASGEQSSVSQYAEAIARQVPDRVSAPLVLAHSGAGPILPQAARLLGASRQVWLAAIVPSGHGSLREEIAAAPIEIFHPDWLGNDPTEAPSLADYFLFHDCDLDTAKWALSTLRRFAPPALYTEQVNLEPDVPSTYIVAAQDRTLRPDWCRRAARERLNAEIIDIDAGHCPHVSQPAQLADVLERLDSW